MTDTPVIRTAETKGFWVAELFHANGNSASVYWSGGDRTHDKVYCAAQFPDSGLCSQVCELLNLRPLPRQGEGKYYRAIEHAMIEADA